MSIKSILYSIFTVVLFCGLLAVSMFLFNIDAIWGIVGIVVTVIVTSIFFRKAVVTATGILDKLLAKVLVPVLILIGIGAILLGFLL